MVFFGNNLVANPRYYNVVKIYTSFRAYGSDLGLKPRGFGRNLQGQRIEFVWGLG